jgi:uncharacterized membrane protein YeaQ/YmgE (transglycosylase-associated protein family)
MFHLIGFIIFGFIVGLLARAIMPGRQHMTILATTVLGIIGSLCAGYFGQALGWYDPDQAGGFIASTIGAILFLSIYHFVMRNRTPEISSTTKSETFPRKVA